MPVRRSIVAIVSSGEETASVETCPSVTAFGRNVLKAAPAANLSSVRLFTSTVSSFAFLRISSSGIETDSLGFFDSIIGPALLLGDHDLHTPVCRRVRVRRNFLLLSSEADRDKAVRVEVEFSYEILPDRLRAALGKSQVVFRGAKGVGVPVDEDGSASELFSREHIPDLIEPCPCSIVYCRRAESKIDLDIRFRPAFYDVRDLPAVLRARCRCSGRLQLIQKVFFCRRCRCSGNRYLQLTKNFVLRRRYVSLRCLFRRRQFRHRERCGGLCVFRTEQARKRIFPRSGGGEGRRDFFYVHPADLYRFGKRSDWFRSVFCLGGKPKHDRGRFRGFGACAL